MAGTWCVTSWNICGGSNTAWIWTLALRFFRVCQHRHSFFPCTSTPMCHSPHHQVLSTSKPCKDLYNMKDMGMWSLEIFLSHILSFNNFASFKCLCVNLDHCFPHPWSLLPSPSIIAALMFGLLCGKAYTLATGIISSAWHYCPLNLCVLLR